MENENEIKNGLFIKMNNLRKDVLTQDWTGDKILPVSKSKFVSIGKIKRQLAPLFAKHGLEVKVDVDAPTVMTDKNQHYLVPVSMTIIDVDTSEREVYKAVGEGIDQTGSGKAMLIAVSYAVRTILLNSLMIVDGIDPEDMVGESVVPAHRRTAEQEEEVRSKVLARSVPEPKVKEENTAPAPAPAQATATEDKTADAPTTGDIAPTTAPSIQDTPRTLTSLQMKALKNAIANLDKMLADGRITQDVRDKLKEEGEAVSDSRALQMFLMHKRTSEGQ